MVYYSFMYLCLCWVFIAAHGLSPVAASRAYSLVEMCGLLIAVASLVAEHSLQAHRRSSCGMWDHPRPWIGPMSPALTSGFLDMIRFSDNY